MVHLENLESCDVENTDEVVPLLLAGQGDVAALHQPDEQPVVDGLAQRSDGGRHLIGNRYLREDLHLSKVTKDLLAVQRVTQLPVITVEYLIF